MKAGILRGFLGLGALFFSVCLPILSNANAEQPKKLDFMSLDRGVPPSAEVARKMELRGGDIAPAPVIEALSIQQEPPARKFHSKLEDINKESAIIFRGVLLGKNTVKGGNALFTEYELKVEEVVAKASGNKIKAGQVITVREIGGEVCETGKECDVLEVSTDGFSSHKLTPGLRGIFSLSKNFEQALFPFNIILQEKDGAVLDDLGRKAVVDASGELKAASPTVVGEPLYHGVSVDVKSAASPSVEGKGAVAKSSAQVFKAASEPEAISVNELVNRFKSVSAK